MPEEGSVCGEVIYIYICKIYITYPISVKALMRPLLWSKPLFQAPKNLNKSYISTMRNL